MNFSLSAIIDFGLLPGPNGPPEIIKRRDQAVTKILTSSSKFSGSYVLTLQTMNWLGHNNETQRTDEEEILEETRARFMSLSGGPYFPFLNRP